MPLGNQSRRGNLCKYYACSCCSCLCCLLQRDMCGSSLYVLRTWKPAKSKESVPKLGAGDGWVYVKPSPIVVCARIMQTVKHL